MIIKRKNICYLRLYALKAGEGYDYNQEYIQIVKRNMVKFGLIKAKTISPLHGNHCKKGLET